MFNLTRFTVKSVEKLHHGTMALSILSTKSLLMGVSPPLGRPATSSLMAADLVTPPSLTVMAPSLLR